MIKRESIPGRVFRVYCPPRPIDGHRDYDAQKVELGPDGTITLHSIESTGEELDIASGRRMQGFKQTILAVIGADGRLRAETIDVAQEPGSALD